MTLGIETHRQCDVLIKIKTVTGVNSYESIYNARGIAIYFLKRNS